MSEPGEEPNNVKPDEQPRGQAPTDGGQESVVQNRQEIQAMIEAAAWGQVEPQLRRLDDYLQQALANPVPLEAIIAASACSLMRCLALMTPDLEVELARSLGTVKKPQAVLDSLEVVHRLARQMNRSTDLGRKLALERSEEEMRRQKDSP